MSAFENDPLCSSGSIAVSLVAALLIWTAACAHNAEPEGVATSLENVLVGQLLLPRGTGSRGVEVLATVAEPGKESRVEWILFDEHGRFSLTVRGSVTQVKVTAATEIHRIDAESLLDLQQPGRIDVGVIDLRHRLTRHRLVVRAAEGKPPGDVRVGMWFGVPPVGPYGESVSLGSRQFPPVTLGSEMEWLLPSSAHSIYFLVERPIGPERGTQWRSGHQRLFGPFTSQNLPAELAMD